MESNFMICAECQRFFEIETGMTPDKYKHIKCVTTDKDLCKQCRHELEERYQWSTTAKIQK